MANGHGGKRVGAGRKTKAETLELDRILNECATEDDIKELFRVLIKNGKRGNINAIMAFMAYKYGKPKERHEITGADGGAIVVKGYVSISPDDWDIQSSSVAS